MIRQPSHLTVQVLYRHIQSVVVSHLILLIRQAHRSWRNLIIAVPYFWLLLFFLIPFVIILKISLSESIIARPPYAPMFEWAEDSAIRIKLTLYNLLYLLQDDLYWKSYVNSVRLAFVSTILCLLIGYPIAYGIARSKPSIRNVLLLLIILPFWTSFLLRVYAWIGLLNNNGVINTMLQWLGITDGPIQMIYTDFALYIGITYSYLPFMILPLYANLEKMDVSLDEAAMDLGAKPVTVFFTVTLPLSIPGIIAGSLLVFIPAVGEYVIPALLGGPDSLMIGRVLFDEFFINRDWPLASSVAIALLLLLVVPIVIFQHYQSRESGDA